MLNLNMLAWLKAGAPPRNVAEAAFRARFAGGASYEKTVGPASIISISDAKPKPAKSLIVGMEPIQAGSGDPSPDNIRPITGRTGVTAWRTGVNLCDHSELAQGVTAYANGELANVANRVTSGFIPVYEGKSYIASIGSGKKVVCYHLYDSAKTGIGWNVNKNTATIPTGVAYVRFVFGNSDDSDITPSNITDAQIELGSTISPYEPYVGASYPVTWQTEAGTVYGCTIDPVSGLLTVTHATETVRGTNIASYSSGLGTVYGQMPSSWDPWKQQLNGSCVAFSHGVASSRNGIVSVENGAFCGDTQGGNQSIMFFKLEGITTSVANAQSYFEGQYTAGTPVQLCYELATPITYQLTPQQIQLLKGSNTLWSDGDTLTLTYLGTTPPNLLGGMLGGGLGGGYTPPEEETEEEEQVPEEEQAEESDPEEVIPDGE